MVPFAGDLDQLSQPVAVGNVDGAMNAGSGRVILDLAALTFIDTSGADAFVRMQQKAERTGVDLVVANPSPAADSTGTPAACTAWPHPGGSPS